MYPVEEPLHAEFQDGTIVDGKRNCQISQVKIKKVSVHCYDEFKLDDSRTPMAAREVINAIMEADMVVLGACGLYTSILSNLND